MITVDKRGPGGAVKVSNSSDSNYTVKSFYSFFSAIYTVHFIHYIENCYR